MAAKTKILKQLSAAYLCRDTTTTPGNTTLTGLAAAGASALTVAAIMNFAAGDLIRIGEGEEMETAVIQGAPAGNTINLANPLTFDHVTGEVVREMTAYTIGDLTDAGVSVAGNVETQDVLVSTRRLPLTTLTGYGDLQADLGIPTLTLYGIAHALGILLSQVTGNGTSATPRTLCIDGNDIAGEQNMALIVVGLRMDNTPARVELWGLDVDHTALQIQFSRGVLASIPARFFAAAGGLIADAAIGFTPDTSLLPTRGHVWDAITEAGIFEDQDAGTPGNSTVASGGAAGALTVTLAAGTNFAANDWVRYGTGDTVEFHQIESVAGAVLTNRSPFKRAQAVGTVAREQKETKFAGVQQDGARLTVAGSSEPIRIATRRLTAGRRPGSATFALALGLIDFTLSTIARAFGIPQSAIVGGRLPITSANIATATVDGVYIKGLLQNGQTCRVHFWGSTFDVSQVAFLLNNQGPPAPTPLTVKPSSGIHFLQAA